VTPGGAFSDKIPISVPAFHGITPELSLGYESSGGNGWVGVGWRVDGVGEIERAGAGRGAPRYDATDVFVVGGEELVPCAASSVSPSCTTGGTHSTENESYARFALTGTGAASRWTVTAKDGTRRVYAPVHSAGTDLVFRWGLSQVVDTADNTVTYTWGSSLFGGGWEYVDSIAYNGTTTAFRYEARPDTEQAAIGGGAGTKTSDHDALGRVVKGVRTIDGTGYTFRFGFDTADRPLWTTYPDGDAQGTAADPLRYDAAGRLVSIPGCVTSARYDAAGELIRVDNANGTVTTRPHDPRRGWLTGISTTAGGTTIQDTTYTRDAKGRSPGWTARSRMSAGPTTTTRRASSPRRPTAPPRRAARPSPTTGSATSPPTPASATTPTTRRTRTR